MPQMRLALVCTYRNWYRPNLYPPHVLGYLYGSSWEHMMWARWQAEEAGYPWRGMQFWIVRLDLPNAAMWWRI
jgi:hypothetical protein